MLAGRGVSGRQRRNDMRTSIEDKVRKDFKFNLVLVFVGSITLFLLGILAQGETQDQRSGGNHDQPTDQRPARQR